jgi:molybdopterin/thiamine biosynthesis adenylyltransferase
LGLLDPDIVDLSNLNRQIMHSFSRIGMSKVQSAEVFLKAINPDIRLDIYNSKIEKESIQSIISSYDIILGCLDDQLDRYILNDACRAAEKPLLEAGALDISGLATLIIPDEEHCQNCTFPESNYGDSLLSASESGVLGPVSGLMGVIQAAETVKHLTDIGSTLKNKILLFDVFDTDIYIVAKERTWHCEFCSNKHSIA